MQTKATLFLFLISFLSWGQQVDSLIVRLESIPAGEHRVDVLNSITTKLRERNLYQAVKYGTEARVLAEKLSYQRGLGLALENLGWVYYRRGIYSEALLLSQQALKIVEGSNSAAVARCLNNVGAISYERGLYPEAINNFKQAYKIAFKGGDYETLIRSLNNVAFSFLAQQQIDSASFYAKRALDEGQLHNDKGGYMLAFGHRILGDIFFQAEDFEKALEQYSKSLQIGKASNNYFIQASTCHRIGMAHNKRGDYAAALKVLNKNIELSISNGYVDELERTYKLVSDIYQSQGNVELALNYLEKYLIMHDSLSNQRNSEQMALLSTQFETEIKQKQIQLLTRNAKLKQEEIENQKAWTFFYVCCFVLVLIVAAVLYYSNLRIKKIHKELKVKSEEVEMQADQLAELNKTKDKLLSIISHDIRSPLASLKGLLDIAQRGDVTASEFSSATKQLSSYLGSLNDDLGNLLQWVYSQLHGLRVNPEVFELKSLAQEVLLLFCDAATDKKIIIRNEIGENLYAFADRNHTKLVLRNLVANAIKFSNRNGQVVIRQSVNDEHFNVSVSDNGVGVKEEDIPKLFDVSSHFTRVGTSNEKGMGVGLILIKEFVEKNGGSIDVKSKLDEGSTFSFTLKKAV